MTTLEAQNRIARAVNYNRWVFEEIAPYIGRRVIDVGCSVGNTTAHILPGRELVVGVDLEAGFLKIAGDRFRGTAFEGFPLDVSDPAFLRLIERSPDTVVALNILEHLEDDRSALVNFHAVLPPGGSLALQVPAHQALFGSLDKTAGHFRRYNRKRLEQLLGETGFQIIKLNYMNLLALPGWFWNGRIRRAVYAPVGQIMAVDRLFPLVKRLERRARPPAGLSLIAAARRL